MAATSDDDVPDLATATGHDDDDVPDLATATGHGKTPDGDTTAAATAPATRTPSSEDEEDRTVQQKVDSKIRNAARNALFADDAPIATPQVVTPPARPPPPRPNPFSGGAGSTAPIPVITSKKMTAVGLGAPASPANRIGAASTTPSSGAVSSSSPSPPTTQPTPETQADATDDSITATQPAPKRVSVNGVPSGIPLTMPGTVKIRTMGEDDDDSLDPLEETEVRTLIAAAPSSEGHPPAPTPEKNALHTSPSPAAGVPPPPAVAPPPPPPSSSSPRDGALDEADEPDDSVTTQAPSPLSAGRLPENEDEPKTSPPMLAPAPLSGAQRLLVEDEPKTASSIAFRVPIPAAGRSPSSAQIDLNTASAQHEDPYANEDVEDSVTTRGPAINPEEYEDDSVTAQAPVTRALAQDHPALFAALDLPPALEEGTEGTTKKVAKRHQVPKTLMSPAASAASRQGARTPSQTETATATEAPNLHAVASTGDPEEEQEEENKTAVMLNAPVKPAPSGSSRAASPRTVLSGHASHAHGGGGGGGGARAVAQIADLREPSSDSGLRVARAEAPSGDHASLNALMPAGSPAIPERGSGVGPTLDQQKASVPSKRGVPPPSPFANTEKAFPSLVPNSARAGARLAPQPSLHEFDFAATVKKPRYGLLVGLVGVLSLAIPLILFLWLKSGPDVGNSRSPSELAPDLVSRGDPARARATKGGPSSSTPTTNPTPTHAPWPPVRRNDRPDWMRNRH